MWTVRKQAYDTSPESTCSYLFRPQTPRGMYFVYFVLSAIATRSLHAPTTAQSTQVSTPKSEPEAGNLLPSGNGKRYTLPCACAGRAKVDVVGQWAGKHMSCKSSERTASPSSLASPFPTPTDEQGRGRVRGGRLKLVLARLPATDICGAIE